MFQRILFAVAACAALGGALMAPATSAQELTGKQKAEGIALLVPAVQKIREAAGQSSDGAGSASNVDCTPHARQGARRPGARRDASITLYDYEGAGGSGSGAAPNIAASQPQASKQTDAPTEQLSLNYSKMSFSCAGRSPPARPSRQR